MSDAYATRNFAADRMLIHLRHHGRIGLPTEIIFTTEHDPGVVSDPCLRLPMSLAADLYHALGVALGEHTPDAKFAAKVLEREQGRVDRLIGHLIGDTE